MWIRFLRCSLGIDFPTQDQLENLRYYKYAAVDKSFITKYVLSHYWNWAITLFPLWIAPNLITLIGLFFMMANVFLVLVYVPDLGTDAPNWIYFSFAAGLWLYSTFDNVDGKQARRTGTSSPLGELFDHGCDALNTTFVTILQCAALGLGHSELTVVMFITTLTGFYFSTAEEYYTQVLYLGYVNGPTEGILLTCAAFIWSGFYGAASWHTPLSEGLPWIAFLFPTGTTAASLFVWSTVFFLLVTQGPVSIYAIYRVCRAKHIDPVEAFATVGFPILVFCLAEYCWLLSPYSFIIKDDHFCLFALTAGLLFGVIASSIILAHLTKTPYPNLAGIVSPLVIMAVLVNLPSLIGIQLLSSMGEYVMLWLIFVGTVIYYAGWVTLVIDGFCRFLNIRCLVIRRDKQVEHRIQVDPESDNLLEAEEQGSSTSRRLDEEDVRASYSTFHQ